MKPRITYLYCFKQRLLVLLLTLFFVPFCNGAQAGTTEEIAWQSLETKYTIIRYQSLTDLAKFCTKVKYGPSYWGLKAFFSRSGHLARTVAKKTDVLFEKVQKILCIYKKPGKVRINIYKNKDQLHEAYSKIYQEARNIRAWYRYPDNTIYVHANDLHEGMLAHELTHAVVDHYLLVRPPRATAEIIARYVDNHLTRRARR